jgi:phosphatidate cytidylyltransferase
VGDFGKRLLSALVIGPLVVLLLLFLPARLLLAFMGCVLVLAAYEFASMAQAADRKTIAVLAALTFLPLYLGLSLYPFWLLLSTTAYLAFRIAAPGRGRGDFSLNREIGRSVAVLVLAEVFLALPLFSLYRLKEIDPLAPLVLVLTIWASDTAAYLVGKNAGRHKLAPLISPKKTYEGLLGALAGAVVVTLIFRKTVGLTPFAAAGVGCAIGLLGQLGDMLESVAKRVCEVKDSSGLIPGHGGLLDRIDSFILSAPFVYYYLAGCGG